jgi:hypothetical protein
MQYKTLKFKNGDLVACGVDDKLTIEKLNDYEYITIQDAVVYSTFKFINQMGQVVETVSMAPYIPTSSDHEILIPTDSILTICDLRPGALDRYLGFLDSLHEELAGKLDKSHSLDIPDADEIWNALEEAALSKLH